MRKARGTRLPSPFLRNLRLRDDLDAAPAAYPYTLPWLQDPEFELDFTTPITIIVGENGVGKSTLIEAIAAIAGYDEAGGGKATGRSIMPGPSTAAAPILPTGCAPPGCPR